MFGSIFAAISGNVILGWVSRRVLEVGGWLTFLINAILLLPPEHQDTIMALLSGQGGALSIAAYLGLAAYVWSQIMSWRSTVRPQVVTSGKKRVTVPVLTEEQARAVTGYQGEIKTRGR